MAKKKPISPVTSKDVKKKLVSLNLNLNNVD